MSCSVTRGNSALWVALLRGTAFTLSFHRNGSGQQHQARLSTISQCRQFRSRLLLLPLLPLLMIISTHVGNRETSASSASLFISSHLIFINVLDFPSCCHTYARKRSPQSRYLRQCQKKKRNTRRLSPSACVLYHFVSIRRMCPAATECAVSSGKRVRGASSRSFEGDASCTCRTSAQSRRARHTAARRSAKRSQVTVQSTKTMGQCSESRRKCSTTQKIGREGLEACRRNTHPCTYSIYDAQEQCPTSREESM